MSRGFSGIVMITTVGLVWGLTSVNHAAPPPAVGGTAVAVINLVKVFNDFKQTKAINERMDEHRVTLGQESDRRKAKIKGLKEARDAFNVDKKEWFVKDEEYRKEQIEFGVWESVQKDRVLEAHQRWIKLTYKMISDEVARIAKTKGYQVVLTAEELDERTDKTEDLLRQIFNRKVIYADPSVDLSQEVLNGLNESFDKAGGAKSIDFLKSGS